MSADNETFHLMAVPKHFTAQVLEAGGRFLKLKKNEWLVAATIPLIQRNQSPENAVHILDSPQHREYEMLGEEYSEDLALCKTVFEQHHDGGYRTFEGTVEMVTCGQCKRILQNRQFQK